MKLHDIFGGQTFLGACIFGRAFVSFRDILISRIYWAFWSTLWIHKYLFLNLNRNTCNISACRFGVVRSRNREYGSRSKVIITTAGATKVTPPWSLT